MLISETPPYRTSTNPRSSPVQRMLDLDRSRADRHGHDSDWRDPCEPSLDPNFASRRRDDLDLTVRQRGCVRRHG
jgi:hypothetical protein